MILLWRAILSQDLKNMITFMIIVAYLLFSYKLLLIYYYIYFFTSYYIIENKNFKDLIKYENMDFNICDSIK